MIPIYVVSQSEQLSKGTRDCPYNIIIERIIFEVFAACDSSQFECDNGSCISQYDVCNGEKNCPDGSDETALTCVSQRQHCTKPYFQCTYGACVIGTAGCNGVNECADGSDETRLRCGNEDDIRQHDRRLQGNCK